MATRATGTRKAAKICRRTTRSEVEGWGDLGAKSKTAVRTAQWLLSKPNLLSEAGKPAKPEGAPLRYPIRNHTLVWVLLRCPGLALWVCNSRPERCGDGPSSGCRGVRSF